MSSVEFPERGSWAVALPLLLSVYVPRTPALGSHYFVYGVLVVVLVVVLASSFLNARRLDRRVVSFLFLMMALAVVTSLSLLVNGEAILATGTTRVLRPLLYVILMVYAYQAALVAGVHGIRRGVLFAAKAILVGQAVIGAAQAVGSGLFDPIYAAEKARPFGGLFRVTGSLSNPNFFGWVVAQSGVAILMFKEEASRYAWLGLATILVVAAGSRTLLLLFPFMVVVAQRLRIRESGGKLAGLALGGVMALGFAGAVVALREILPYLGQLQDLFAAASFTAIGALEQRIEHWLRVGEEFIRGGSLTWLLGLSDRPMTQVLDNDYLFILFRTGLVGLLVHLAFLGYLWVMLRRTMWAGISRLGVQYLLFALVFGLVADTLAGWFTPIWLVLFMGLAVGLDREGSARPDRPLGAAVGKDVSSMET